MCLLGLLISFILYKQYNTIQTQKLTYTADATANLNTLDHNVVFCFEYGDGDKFDFKLAEDISITGSYFLDRWNLVNISSPDCPKVIPDTIVANSVLTQSNPEIYSEVRSKGMFDAFIRSSLIAEFDDNLWMFPHPVNRRNFNKYQNIIKFESKEKTLVTKSIVELEPQTSSERTFLGLTFGKEKHVFDYESFKAFDISDSIVCYNGDIDMPEAINPPHLFSAFDVSQLDLSIRLDCDTLSQFTILYNCPVEYLEIIPSPDFKNSREISFTNPKKIKQLRENGMHIYLRFPNLMYLQQTRNYILSALITLFLSLLATYIYAIVKKAYKKCQKIRHSQSMQNYKHPRLILRLHLEVLSYVLIAAMVIMTVIFLINPYKWSGLVMLSIALSATCAIIGYYCGIKNRKWAKRAPYSIKKMMFKYYFIFVVSASVCLILALVLYYAREFAKFSDIIYVVAFVIVLLFFNFYFEYKKLRKIQDKKKS